MLGVSRLLGVSRGGCSRWGRSRLPVRLLLLLLALGTGLFGLPHLPGLFTPLRAASNSATSNPIVLENQQPGTDEWLIPSAGHQVADDTANQVKGYTAAASVNKGSDLPFFVTDNPVQTFTFYIFRLGWFGSIGGRLI